MVEGFGQIWEELESAIRASVEKVGDVGEDEDEDKHHGEHNTSIPQIFNQVEEALTDGHHENSADERTQEG